MNPARGRKLVELAVYVVRDRGLDNLEPREGTETTCTAPYPRACNRRWITLNPARGQKIINVDAVGSVSKSSAFIQIANDMLVSCN